MTDISAGSFQEITDFMQAVKSKTACPCCDNHHWSVECAWDPETQKEIVDVSMVPYGLAPIDGDLSITTCIRSSGLAAIPFVCTQCGFIRLHSYAAFRQWRDNDRVKEDTEK